MNDYLFKEYLSSYLAAEKVEDLFESIKNFPENIEKIYVKDNRSYYLQGDCVDNLPMTRLFEKDGILNCQTIYGKAVILNNSCDISEEREGGRKVNLFYSPLISLTKFEQMLERSGKNKEQICNYLKQIKKQTLSHIMYFPAFCGNKEEYLIMFDKIFSCDYDLAKKYIKHRIFSLSNYGFYSFILKMSVHFLRIREREDRDVVNK